MELVLTESRKIEVEYIKSDIEKDKHRTDDIH